MVILFKAIVPAAPAWAIHKSCGAAGTTLEDDPADIMTERPHWKS
jgi:hypothetical protein